MIEQEAAFPPAQKESPGIPANGICPFTDILGLFLRAMSQADKFACQFDECRDNE